MNKRIFVTLLVVMALVAVPAAAQQLTGSISGNVKDTTGAPLPGVTVTITGKVLQGSRTAVSRTDGTYKVIYLPAGDEYKVVFAISGFRSFEATKLSVQIAQDTRVDAAMELSKVQAEVIVTSEAPVVDTTRMNTQQNYDPSYMKKIPIGSASRSYQSIVQQAAGVAGGSNPNSMGGNLQENSFLVDAVNTTDPVTHTFSFNMNYDAIQEVSLQTSSYLPQYGRSTGAVVNVVTKSGGNEFSGSFDIRYDNNTWVQTTNTFNHSLSPSRNTPWGVTVGGPILKDQLWFFGNTQRADNYSTPYTTNQTLISQNPTPWPVRRFTGWNSGGKLSFTILPELTGFFSLQDSFAKIPGATNSVTYRPEAVAEQDQTSRIYSLVLNGIVNQNWSVDLQGGFATSEVKAFPLSGIIDGASYWSNRTGGGVVYDNYNNVQGGPRNRSLAGLSSTYFVTDLLGNHQIKAGFDADHTWFPSYNYTTGSPSDPSFCPGTSGRTCGATFTFNGFDASGNRIPYQQTVTERASTEANPLGRSGNSMAFYLQDQWTPLRNVTVNFGARWDDSQYLNNVNKKFLTFVKWQPRVGVSWDATGDGRTRVSADYGTFYYDPALTFNRVFYSDTTSAASRLYQWSGTPTGGHWNFVRQTGGTYLTQALIDGQLKPTYDDQLNLAVQREIVRGLSATFTYIWKKTNDIFEDTCIDAPCTNYWMSNNPQGGSSGITNALAKNYYGYMLDVQYRFSRGQILFNYVYSKSQGSIDSSSTQFAGGDFDHYPENFVNRYGYLSDDARHRFKFYGTYTIPFIEADFGWAYNYRSGLAYTVTTSDPNGWGTVYAEPRGNSRTPIQQQIDLEIRKRVYIGQTLYVTPIFSVLNITNSEQPLTFGASLTSPSTLGLPLTFQTPRRYQVGIRFDWNN